MKNALFHIKISFVLEIFRFLSWYFAYVEKRLDKKAMDNFKIYDIPDWTNNNYNTQPNISRHKGNQAMKFGHLIKYKMRNIFLKKSYRKHVG